MTHLSYEITDVIEEERDNDPESIYGKHKGRNFHKYISFENDDYPQIDGISVMLVWFQDSNDWLIITVDVDDEERFEDIGPFEDLDAALVTFKLTSD